MSVFGFPMNRAKALRDDPPRWYQLAVEYLPLPAAFTEAAKALRADIRARRKAGEPYGELLVDLYRLACLHNLLIGEGAFQGRPKYWEAVYSEPLPRELWEGAQFPYDQIGHEHLSLLGVNDRKWIEQAWGPREVHRPARKLNLEIEESLAKHLRAAWRRENERYRARMQEILAHPTASPQPKQGCALMALTVVGGMGALVLLLIVW